MVIFVYIQYLTHLCLSQIPKMDFDTLSHNGIEKVLCNAPSIIQIIDLQLKQKGESNFFIVQISDGFSRLKKCVIMPENQKKVKNFDVIKTQFVTPNIKDGKPLHVLIEQFSVIRNDLVQMIGQPINYADWEKTRTNPKGQNLIPPKKSLPLKPQAEKLGINVAFLFEDEDQNQQRLINKNPAQQQMSRKASQITKTQSISHSVISNLEKAKNKPHYHHSQEISSTIHNRASNFPPVNQPKIIQNNIKPQNNCLAPPKNKQSRHDNRQGHQNNQYVCHDNHSNIPSNNQARHERSYTLIKQLYESMEDWKLKIRVIFMSELRTFTKKSNGQQSQVFSFQGCDLCGSLQFSVFGDVAANISSAIELDNVYEIIGGKISKDEQKNKLKVMLTQKTVINLIQDDFSIPSVEKYCITPEKLLQKQIGTESNVIALVKDVNEVIEFISKNGKKCKKKDIFLCDPEAHIEIPLTLWFQKAQIKFQRVPYAFQGIMVSSFQDQKQFSTSIKFNYRIYKQHNFRKFISTFEKMKLENPVQDFSAKNKPNFELINFYVLRTEAEKLQNTNSLTMQKVCYLTQISLSSKNFYMSCPYCKRKVFEEQNGYCSSEKCAKSYTKAKFRYLLNVSLSDQSETIWATAYDEAAEVMLTSEIDNTPLSADEFSKLSEEDLKLKIPFYLDRQIKVTVVAKKQTYNGQQKVKFGINKASLQIDYANQSKLMRRQMEYLMGEMKIK